MEVILQENMPSLGAAGEVVKVKDGFARNFLLPQGKAVVAEAGKLKMLEHQKKQALAREAKLRKSAEELAVKMGNCRPKVAKEAGPEGKLFGSVTAEEVVSLLKGEGYSVDRKQVKLTAPVKDVGEHVVEVKLHPEVAAQVTLNVVAK